MNTGGIYKEERKKEADSLFISDLLKSEIVPLKWVFIIYGNKLTRFILNNKRCTNRKWMKEEV